ncbi:D-alanyl-D-alanine carboxypeptidase [Microbacterium sp. zg.B48]|uniref:D-alanyl-D-alanine carboxypeptidase n=1 Tax=Microbacterium sp. zg.B48 TaxID=2969408 RepID=UPI00214B54E5|nr:D-alanyl-D-alanine carboxypeptidase [Microbacterium sp. zg.B48]MCR2763006.1 D-alanyl-D-alanine carboxypeptidase [Microbacterium sp. zg.B48]
MTPDDAAAPTRRSVRLQRGDARYADGSSETAAPPTVAVSGALAQVTAAGPPSSSTPAPAVGASTAVAAGSPIGPTTKAALRQTAPSRTARPTALEWVDERTLVLTPPAARTLEVPASPYVVVEPDLLADAPRRSLWRAGVLLPIAIIALVLGAYSATTLLWPLHAVAPTVEAMDVQPLAAPAAALSWPAEGSASVAVAGIEGLATSTVETAPIASITKVVTALLVLDQMPLAVGEQGPEFRFTARDSNAYWGYRENGESALDVPVGGSLTEYQMLEGMLIGSANNYADRLAGALWPNDAVFARAANTWLAAHGVPGVTVVEPTGLDPRNSASPDALIALAQRAMAHPVIAEIVAKPAVELPGAGLVTNTNALLADAGVVGIKTGSLDSFSLLSAKDIVVGETTVRVYSAVLGQPDGEVRLAVSRTLYSEVELALQPVPSVTKGTVVGHVTTEWGQNVAIVTDDDASVILWNGGVGAVTTDFALGDAREKGAAVGTLAVRGPLDSTGTALELAADIEPPSAWWRLTHPLDLFGLN